MPNSPFFSLTDDNGNDRNPINAPLNTNNGLKKGDSSGKDSDGNKFPIGFTPNSDFYINPSNLNPVSGLPAESGNITKTPNTGIIKGKIETSSIGFTPEPSFFINSKNLNPRTGLPIEYGNAYPSTTTVGGSNTTTPQDTNDKLADNLAVYNAFNNLSGENFLHSLDRKVPIGSFGGSSSTTLNTSQVYLASYISTTTDNEDPTMFGYDIIIDYDNSPLFNGALLNFLSDSRFTQYSEISSRVNIYNQFITQFFKFFESSVTPPTKTIGSGVPNNFLNRTLNNPITYYLKKLSGLDNLVEQNTSNIIKSFVEYGKDMIGLSIYEDVSTNLGYLSSLYKTLAWSRITGKYIVPENLLRFDAQIVITEIKSYNRFINSNNQIINYADLLSKYIYKLYECQFFFTKMTHGNEIDMSAPRTVDEFDVMFNYKYSTLSFEKMNFVGQSAIPTIIDNSLLNLSSVKPINTNNANVLGSQSIQTQPASTTLTQITGASAGSLSIVNTSNKSANKSTLPKTALNNAPNTFAGLGKSQTPTSILLNTLKNIGIAQINGQISLQARLLNRTLTNIRNALGIGQIPPPTNVYTGGEINQVAQDIQNALANFVGQSVKGFFTK